MPLVRNLLRWQLKGLPFRSRRSTCNERNTALSVETSTPPYEEYNTLGVSSSTAVASMTMNMAQRGVVAAALSDTRRTVKAVTATTALLLVVSCAPHTVSETYRADAPRQDTVEALQALGIAETDYGRRWIAAGDAAEGNAAEVELPYRGEMIFDPYRPEARVIDVVVTRPGRYAIVVRSGSGAYFFLELYRYHRNELRQAASRSDAMPRIEIDIRREGKYRVFLQPEPLRGGRAEISVQPLEEE